MPPPPPPTNPLSGNPLRTRGNLQEALRAILTPLAAFTSPGGAQVRLGETAVHYDETAANLEGFARPLWGLASLLGGGADFDGQQKWVDGLKAGTDPESDEYWGEVRDRDQRMVEMCPMGYWLALCGPGENGFWKDFSGKEKSNVVAWFGSVNTREVGSMNICLCPTSD